jgi:hypothetical protein
MTHEHGSEYQVRIVHEDETEKLSGWMTCPQEIAQAITGLGRRRARAYWLRVRNILCLDCRYREATIVEFPLSLIESEKTRFHDRQRRSTNLPVVTEPYRPRKTDTLEAQQS